MYEPRIGEGLRTFWTFDSILRKLLSKSEKKKRKTRENLVSDMSDDMQTRGTNGCISLSVASCIIGIELAMTLLYIAFNVWTMDLV